MVLAKEYEKDGRVLILAPESLYGLSTLSKSFEGLERMYRAGYAAAEAIPSFLESCGWRPHTHWMRTRRIHRLRAVRFQIET